MKAFPPYNQCPAESAFCMICVYHSMNLDRAMYDGKGLADLPENGCSLDFTLDDRNCREMRTSNCSVRKAR